MWLLLRLPRRGPNICPHKIGLGYEWDGGYAEYLSVPQVAIRNLISIPPGLPFDETSLMEPLSCCLHGQGQLNIGPEDQVLIIGAGPIGVMHLLLAKGKGVAKTILLEIQEERLESALLFDPDIPLDAREEDVEEKVGEETDGRGADVVIVACSSASAQEQGVRLVGKGGRVLFFAGLPREVPFIRFDSNRIHYEEISVYGSFASQLEQGREALDLIADRAFDFGRLITHRLPLEGILEGIDLVGKGRGLKVIIHPGG